jgi:hypothetical protein
MKTLVTIIIISLGLVLAGCSDNSLTASVETLNAKKNKTTSGTLDVQSSSVGVTNYPQSGHAVVYFKNAKDEYTGSTVTLENGSSFDFSNGALIPPAYITWGDQVTITMHAEKDPDSGDLIFSFGPSGCQFLEPATLILDYADLGTDKATLYYLDHDGNRIEHLPDNIDFYNRQMCIYIEHFSRYAVAYAD